MQVYIDIRTEMLEIIKISLEHGSSPKLIVFKDDSGITLAEMPFDELESIGSDAQYRFKALDGSYSLKASVITSGRVAEFSIDGENPAIPGQVTALSGTVGGYGSNSDIRFNRRDWSESGVITLNNLTLILRQGQN